MTHTTNQIVPEVGMGATMQVGSDSYPYTIHKVSDDSKKIWASEDNHHVIGGPYEYGQDVPYEYSNDNQNDESQWSLFTLRKNGHYILKGAGINDYYRALHIGYRRYYRDPSF